MALEPPRKLGRTARAAHLLEQIRDDLPPALNKTLSAVQAEQPSVQGVLRAWRRLSTASDLTAAQRFIVRENIVNAFARMLEQAKKGQLVPYSAQDFGVRGSRELADLFLTSLERVGYGRIRLSKLADFRQIMIGELLEVLVRNSRTLRPALLSMARKQLELVLQPSTVLVTAQGRPFKSKVQFGPVTTATDVYVKDAAGRRKFIDFMHVSTGVRSDGQLVVVILVETEVKMPVAARGAGRQIGRAQQRFQLLNRGELFMTVEGQGEVRVTPQRIVFAPKAIDRTLITIADTPQYKFRSTARGGYDEVFLQVSLQMRAEFVRRLVALAIPGG